MTFPRGAATLPAAVVTALPFILYEDDHLLVVNKPAGWSTHAPALYAGDGVYDWLRHREPRWAALAIIHRLDKETSGIMVFSKSREGNRSLTEQFAQRRVRKRYHLLTDRLPPSNPFVARSTLVRQGDKYVSRPRRADEPLAETRFEVLEKRRGGHLVAAEPLTGRTHQIRAQAAAHGFPVLGDTLYGGTGAGRVCLHAAELTFRHPVSGTPMTFQAAVDFAASTGAVLRNAFLPPAETTAFRLVQGAADGYPGWYVDRLGEFLLSRAAQPLTAEHEAMLTRWRRELAARGVYHKRLDRPVPTTAGKPVAPTLVSGEAAPSSFVVRENGVQFTLSFHEGHSVGLFLDQRDNRRRLLANHIAAGMPAFRRAPAESEVLNLFAYTCGFSVCAALAGARSASVDLSKNYLEWGRRNFVLNGLDPARQDFICGDALDWLRRWGRQGRRFDLVLVDPPTFSRSRQGGAFSLLQDYGRLVQAAAHLVNPEGVLFLSTNAAKLAPGDFVRDVRANLGAAGRKILQEHYAPQPPDFPVSRLEPAFLKTLWLRLR